MIPIFGAVCWYGFNTFLILYRLAGGMIGIIGSGMETLGTYLTSIFSGCAGAEIIVGVRFGGASSYSDEG